jgi:hypothetical protein
MPGEKKLKTLKDLKQDFTDGLKSCQKGYSRTYCAYFTDLRESAKEWIKGLDDETGVFQDGIENGVFFETEEIIKWIKHFFNLDDEVKP